MHCVKQLEEFPSILPFHFLLDWVLCFPLSLPSPSRFLIGYSIFPHFPCISFILLMCGWLCPDTVCSNVVEFTFRLIYHPSWDPLGLLFEGCIFQIYAFFNNQQEWSGSEFSWSSIQPFENTQLCWLVLSSLPFHLGRTCPQVSFVAPEPSPWSASSPVCLFNNHAPSSHSEKEKHKTSHRFCFTSSLAVLLRILSLFPKLQGNFWFKDR